MRRGVFIKNCSNRPGDYNFYYFFRREREQRIGQMQEQKEKMRQQVARDKVKYNDVITI